MGASAPRSGRAFRTSECPKDALGNSQTMRVARKGSRMQVIVTLVLRAPCSDRWYAPSAPCICDAACPKKHCDKRRVCASLVGGAAGRRGLTVQITEDAPHPFPLRTKQLSPQDVRGWLSRGSGGSAGTRLPFWRRDGGEVLRFRRLIGLRRGGL